jgi:hypothetical protein
MPLTSSWNPQYALWAPAPLAPHDWNNKKSIIRPFIRSIEHANQIRTVTVYSYTNTNTAQPPGQKMQRDDQKKDYVGKLRNTATDNSQPVTDTPSQKYENYLREYTLHRNKCISIIRDAFQDIRAMLHDRDTKRNNTTPSRTSQYNAHFETVQLSNPHRVKHNKHTEHKLTTLDKNFHRVHTHTTRRGATETKIGPDNRDNTLNDITQSYHTSNLIQTTLHDNTTLAHVHNSVGGKHSIQVSTHLLTLNRGGNRLSQSQPRPENTENMKYCTHTLKRKITSQTGRIRHRGTLHTTKPQSLTIFGTP